MKRILSYTGEHQQVFRQLFKRPKWGRTVAIVEFSNHIGGMTASGLGATDFGAEDAVGGLSREFYQEIATYYGKEKQWTFEPKAAQYVFAQWIKEYEIPFI